jgi:hypothetical protein
MLAVLAAFFCLLFFAAAKKSRCRPAQGRRLKQANKSRMPAQRPKHQTAAPEARRHNADASQRPNKSKRLRREGANADASPTTKPQKQIVADNT